MVDRHKSWEDLTFGGASFPVHITDPALDIGGQTAAAGDTQDIGMPNEFLPDNLHRVPGFFLHQVIDNVLLGHAEVPVHDERDLGINDKSPDDEHGRESELEDDEDFAEKRAVSSSMGEGLDYPCRCECREKQGGIETRNESGKNDDCGEPEQEIDLSKVKAQPASCDLIEDGQGKFHQENGCGHGQAGMEEGLAEKLPDELSSCSSQCLPKSDFLGAPFKAGCGQVHEINAGDKQDEASHQGKNADVSHQPVRTVRIEEVDPGEFLKTEDLVQARSAGFQEPGDFLFQERGGTALSKKEIDVIVLAVPVGFQGSQVEVE